MKITSSVFENNGRIPQKYTCDGIDINPPFEFEDVPADSASLVLIVSDPDAPGNTFYHWLVFNIDPMVSKIEEDSMPPDAVFGINSSQSQEYIGPCPPSGTHRYFFTLYALDDFLDLDGNITVSDLKEEMKGHILETAELVGLYGHDQGK